MEGLADQLQLADGLEDGRFDAGFPEDAVLVIADEAAVIAGQVIIFDAIVFELGMSMPWSRPDTTPNLWPAARHLRIASASRAVMISSRNRVPS